MEEDTLTCASTSIQMTIPIELDEPSPFNSEAVMDDLVKTYNHLQRTFHSLVSNFEEIYTLDIDSALEERRQGTEIYKLLSERVLSQTAEIVWEIRKKIGNRIRCLRRSLADCFDNYNTLVEFSVEKNWTKDHAERLMEILRRDFIWVEKLLREGLEWSDLLQDFKGLIIDALSFSK